MQISACSTVRIRDAVTKIDKIEADIENFLPVTTALAKIFVHLSIILDEIITSIDSLTKLILAINSSPKQKIIALYNWAASNNFASFVYLSFIAQSSFFFIIFIWLTNYSTLLLKSFFSIWVLESIILSTNLSIHTFTKCITSFLSFAKLYPVWSFSNSQIIFQKIVLFLSLYSFEYSQHSHIKINFS